jgi:hypothetical protein
MAKNWLYVPGNPGNPGLVVSLVGLGVFFYYNRKAQGLYETAPVGGSDYQTVMTAAQGAHTMENVGGAMLLGGLIYYAAKGGVFFAKRS